MCDRLSSASANGTAVKLDYKYNTRQETDGERAIGAIQKVEGEAGYV